MKLYFWDDPFPVEYGGSMLFVVAESEEQARELARTGKTYSYGVYPERTTPNIELGKPDRVVDLPCAEWHWWSE